MRKRKFVCGMFALCLALSAAGCRKGSEEQQAANYYQNELGLDKEDAEELAHEIYGEDEEESGVSTEEVQEETVVEPLPELVNSEWYDFKVQIYDMVFDNYSDMTEEDIRKIVEGSAYDVELTEGFDSEGNISFNSIEIDGKCVAILQKCRPHGGYFNGSPNDDGLRNALRCGLLNDESYYVFSYGSFSTENTWYDKKSIEFMDIKTRDGVLAYLAENGFAEVESNDFGLAGPYYWMAPEQNGWFDGSEIDSDDVLEIKVEYDDDNNLADVPFYYCKGAQRITLCRSHKISETDDQVKVWGERHEEVYSGAHLNYVNSVIFEFNTDGTIASISWRVARYIIYGEQID